MSPIPRPPRQPHYRSLDIWRGVACLLVVVFHSTFYASHASVGSGGLWATVVRGTQVLWIGVPVFFVISGYCIAATADKGRLRGTSVREYFWRRFRRIFPPYWAALVLTVAVVLAGERLSPGLFYDDHHPFTPVANFGFWQWAGNVTLSEGWRGLLVGGPSASPWPWFLGQAWTLGYEEQFYAVTGLALLLMPHRFFGAMAAVTVLVAGLYAVLPTRDSGLFLFNGMWLQFAAGVAVYYAINHATPGGRLALALVIAATGLGAAVRARGLVITGWVVNPGHHTISLLAACAFAGVALALHRFDAVVCQAKSLAPIRLCGAMCYSLYLVHWPICKAISHVMYDCGVTSPWASMLLTVPTCVAASGVAGWGFYLLVESRFLNSGIGGAGGVASPTKPAEIHAPIPV